MPRTNFLPFIILAVLTAPLVHVLSLQNSSAADLVYAFVTYQYEQHRTLAWIAFVLGGLLTGYVYIWGTLMLFLGKA